MQKETKKAPSYTFSHLGMNMSSEASCMETREQFKKAFDFPSIDTGKSVIVEGSLELLKKAESGKYGHIGIETDNIEAAMDDLASKGVHFDETTLVRRTDGVIQSVYLRERFGGFAVHLPRK